MSERERIVDRLTRLVDDPDGLDDPDARAIIVAVLFRVEVVGDVPTELLTTLYRVALWCRDGIRNVETVRDVGLEILRRGAFTSFGDPSPAGAEA